MSIEIQPPVDLRPRYKSDGKRQIEKARTNPMVVKVTVELRFCRKLILSFSYPMT
jgi:hypothetical protein